MFVIKGDVLTEAMKYLRKKEPFKCRVIVVSAVGVALKEVRVSNVNIEKKGKCYRLMATTTDSLFKYEIRSILIAYIDAIYIVVI